MSGRTLNGKPGLAPKIFVFWNPHKHCYTLRVRDAVVAHASSFILLGCVPHIDTMQQAKMRETLQANAHAFLVARGIIFFPNRRDSLMVVPTMFDKYVVQRANCLLQWIPGNVNTQEVEQYLPFITHKRAQLTYNDYTDSNFAIQYPNGATSPITAFDSFDVYCGMEGTGYGGRKPVREIVRYYPAASLADQRKHTMAQLDTIRAFNADLAVDERNRMAALDKLPVTFTSQVKAGSKGHAGMRSGGRKPHSLSYFNRDPKASKNINYVE